MRAPPFVSIGLTTYDRLDLLRQSVSAILGQTFVDFELVVGNDNPTRTLTPSDIGTEDSRVRIVNQPRNLGQVGNWRSLLEHATGRYFTWIADDDLYAPDFLAACHAAVAAHGSPACVYGSFDIHSGQDTAILAPAFSGQTLALSGSELLWGYLLGKAPLLGNMGVFDRHFLLSNTPWDEMECPGVALFREYVFVFLAARLAKVAYIPDKLIRFRDHADSWGSSNAKISDYHSAGRWLIHQARSILAGTQDQAAEEQLVQLVFNLALRQLVSKRKNVNFTIDVESLFEDFLGLSKTSASKAGQLDAVEWTAQPEGRGVFLSLCRQFVASETGRIDKEAEIGRLATAVQERAAVIEFLSTETAKRLQLIDQLSDELAVREQIIARQGQPFAYAQTARTRKDGATAGRQTTLLQECLGPLLSRLQAIVAPRLGNLRQHPPRRLLHIAPYDCRVAPNTLPKISVVTPSYQQGRFIERTIRSVLNQDYPQNEYIVQDGGSTDGTVSVLGKYDGQLAHWESRPDNGQAHAVNLGLTHASGEIMACLNSDDLLLPGALACVGDYFARHPDVDVVYGNRLLIDENDMQIGRWILPDHDDEVLRWADYIPQETLFWRRSAWEKAGAKLDESYHFAIGWDLLARFRNTGARFAHIPRFLGALRVHDRQKSAGAISAAGFREMDRIRERTLGRAPSAEEINRALRSFLMRHLVKDVAYRINMRLAKTQST